MKTKTKVGLAVSFSLFVASPFLTWPLMNWYRTAVVKVATSLGWEPETAFWMLVMGAFVFLLSAFVLTFPD